MAWQPASVYMYLNVSLSSTSATWLFVLVQYTLVYIYTLLVVKSDIRSLVQATTACVIHSICPGLTSASNTIHYRYFLPAVDTSKKLLGRGNSVLGS